MWIAIGNTAAYEVGVGNIIRGAIRVEQDFENLEDFLDNLSEAATGSIAGLEDISYTVFDGTCFFTGRLVEDTLDGVDELDPQNPRHRAKLEANLVSRYRLIETEIRHAIDSLGVAYENEAVIMLPNGRELRSPAHPEPCSYVRITLPGVTPIELAYWTEDELRDAPAEVMGALLGAAGSEVLS